MTATPAQSLDNLPRPGVAISRERWLTLIAAELKLADLRGDLAQILAKARSPMKGDPLLDEIAEIAAASLLK